MPLRFYDDQPQPTVGTGEDVARSAAAGAARGVLSVPGMVGDVAQLSNDAAYWLERQLRGETPEQFDQTVAARKEASPLKGIVPPVDQWPDLSTEGFVKAIGPEFAQYEPQTTAGKFAKTGTEFATGSAALAGAVARQAPRIGRDVVATGLAPGLASEAAGQAAEGTGYEGPVRAATAVATGVAGNAATAARTPGQVVGRAAAGATPQQLDAAEELFTRAASMGVPITRAQALHQVTGGATSLPDVQRVVEGQGGLRDFFAPLPGGVRAAGNEAIESMGPLTPNVAQIGPDAAQAADTAISGVRREINDQTRPLYDAAMGDTLSPQDLSRLQANPLYRRTVEELRNDPELQGYTNGLPEESVVFQDYVRRRMAEQQQNARAPGERMSEMRAASYEGVQQDIGRSTADASRALEIAREQQEQLRRLYLAPLENGPLGKIRDRRETQGAIQALFPQGGVQPSPTEITSAVANLRAAPGGEWAARQLVQTYLKSQFDQATKGVQAGANQWGGATFNAMVRGNAQMAENLQAAVQALPDGPERWQGIQRFLEVMEATGARQRQGSATAFNQELQQRLKSGGTVEELGKVAATGTVGGPRRIREAVENWQMGRNTGELARLFTDPRAGARFRQLAQQAPDSSVSLRLVGSLAALALRGSGQDDSGPRLRYND